MFRHLQYNDQGETIYIINEKGKAALSVYEQQCKAQADQDKQEALDKQQAAADFKKQRRYDIWMVVFSVLLGAICTLCIEHFMSILHFFRSLFS